MRSLCGQILAAAVMASCSAWAVGSGESFMSLAASEGAELVFCGADDLKASAPQGDQYAVTAVRVNKNGVETPLKRRTPVMDERTAYGRLNGLLRGLKEGHPERDIALVALPGSSAAVVRAAGGAWAVPVVDLSEGEPSSLSASSGNMAHLPVSVARPSLWRGRRVAFLGDSITDARHIGCTSNYWNFLERDMGIVPLVYGINGHQFKHLLGQAETLYAAHSNAALTIQPKG